MILQPVSGLVVELQKHQASCEAALGPFLDGQLSGIAQLSLTAVFCFEKLGRPWKHKI
jgi:hypothetical protein